MRARRVTPFLSCSHNSSGWKPSGRVLMLFTGHTFFFGRPYLSSCTLKTIPPAMTEHESGAALVGCAPQSTPTSQTVGHISADAGAMALGRRGALVSKARGSSPVSPRGRRELRGAPPEIKRDRTAYRSCRSFPDQSMKRLNPRRVKIHRSYTVEEAATVLGVHKNTVRNWLASGLQSIDQRRPLLILGRALSTFLHARRSARRQRCGPAQFYCVRCRAPREPVGRAADYVPISSTSGNLRGRCDYCGMLIWRRVSLTRLELLVTHLAVSF